MAKKQNTQFIPQNECDEQVIKKDWGRYKKGQKVKMHPSIASKLKKLEVI